MTSRERLLTILLGITGIVAAGAIALAANAISGDSIGLSAQPVSLASSSPAPKPAPAKREQGDGHASSSSSGSDGTVTTAEDSGGSNSGPGSSGDNGSSGSSGGGSGEDHHHGGSTGGPSGTSGTSDSGPLDDDVARHAFERFYRGPGGGPGTGLGLPIVQALVRRRGGRARLQAVDQRQVRAEVSLPTADFANS